MGSTGKLVNKSISSLESQDTSWKDNLVNASDVDEFVRANLDNPDFMQFGRDNGMDEIENLWREMRTKKELENLHEMSIEDAIRVVEDNIRAGTLSGWFRAADSSAKPVLIEQILANPGTLNAGMNIAYYNYVAENRLKDSNFKPLPFNEWLTTPQTVYRGEVDPAYGGKKYGKNDIFMSYSVNKAIADSFANYTGGNVHSITIRPIDTWGSYQTTGEQEFLVPTKHYRSKS